MLVYIIDQTEQYDYIENHLIVIELRDNSANPQLTNQKLCTRPQRITKVWHQVSGTGKQTRTPSFQDMD